MGTFFHEACGHQPETTNMQSEDSCFRDKLGCKVASEKVTLIDDGAIPGMYGSSKYDDEGMTRQFGVPRTGFGCRENYTYTHAPS